MTLSEAERIKIELLGKEIAGIKERLDKSQDRWAKEDAHWAKVEARFKCGEVVYNLKESVIEAAKALRQYKSFQAYRLKLLDIAVDELSAAERGEACNKSAKAESEPT